MRRTQRNRYKSAVPPIWGAIETDETFKLVALGRNWDEPQAAFIHQDLRDSL